MAVHATGRNRIVLDSGVSPIYRVMLRSYTRNLHVEFEEVEVVHGQSNRARLQAAITDQTAAVIVRGRLHMVNAYGWQHLALLIEVARQYPNTAALVAKIGA